MRRLMAILAAGAILVLGGCGSAGSGTPAPIPNPGVVSTPPSSTSAPTSASAPAAFDSATIAKLQGYAAAVQKFTDDAFANKQPLDPKAASACASTAKEYNQIVSDLKLTASQLGSQLLPLNLSCD